MLLSFLYQVLVLPFDSFIRQMMDSDVSRWSLDFLLRNSIAVTETLIKKMLRATPLSHTDSRFKKTVLLKTLQDDLSTATIAESMLEILEVLEELHRCDGSPITAAMSAAYCAIAVECTLKYLELEVSIYNNSAYLNAVERIWRGRVEYMEPSSASGDDGSLLFSAELKRWRSDIEASLLDSQVMERLAGINTRRDAIHKLKAFLAEAWAELGPSFLELAASLPMTANKGFQLQTSTGNLVDDDEPSCRSDGDLVSDAQPTSKGDEGADTITRGACIDTHTIELDGHELGVSDSPPQQDKVAPTEIQEENETTTGVEEVDPSKTCSKIDSVPSPEVQEDTLVKDPHESRFHLPSPKRKKMSPLKKYDPENLTRRRKPKKWSATEEETLRNAVNKIGQGNWKLILNSHKDIFAERTTIDLKDKWRNMMRYGGK